MPQDSLLQLIRQAAQKCAACCFREIAQAKENQRVQAVAEVRVHIEAYQTRTAAEVLAYEYRHAVGTVRQGADETVQQVDLSFRNLQRFLPVPGDLVQGHIPDLVFTHQIRVQKLWNSILEGKIIGKGDPGCIFSEDYIVKDKTGILFVDYKQPLRILDKIFSIFKSAKYVDQDVIIRGWYRRNPTPFIEIYEWEALGEHKKIYTYKTKLVCYAIMAIISLVLIIWHFI